MGKLDNLKVATVFSGIGAFEYALKKRGTKHSIVFACDCGDRKIELSKEKIQEFLDITDSKEKYNEVEKFYKSLPKENRVKQTYFKNYNISDDKWYSDIRFVDGEQFKDKVDIFVGGSPCQSFSLMGKRGGLDDTRGTLFYEYARLVKEIKPKVFIYENVPGMLQHDGGKTWEKIKEVFEDPELDYDIHYDILNSKDYGIPQNRRRLFVVGFRGHNNIRNFSFPDKIEELEEASKFYDKKIDDKYYLGEKGFKFVTSPKYKGRATINSKIIRTQKRNQQFNWNGDFVFVPVTDKTRVPSNAYVGEYQGKKGMVRKLTPRECHRLMGFGDDFVINEHDVDAYKQSGNSIVVNVLSLILDKIEEVGIDD